MADSKKASEAEARLLARKASRHHIDTEGTLADPAPKPAAAAAAAAEKKKEVKLAGWKHFTAGAVAGVAEVLATQPLDTCALPPPPGARARRGRSRRRANEH